MQENPYYKPGGEVPQPDPFNGGLPGTLPPTGFAENSGIFGGGADWATAGTGFGAGDPHLQQDAVDNTAVGNINIPA